MSYGTFRNVRKLVVLSITFCFLGLASPLVVNGWITVLQRKLRYEEEVRRDQRQTEVRKLRASQIEGHRQRVVEIYTRKAEAEKALAAGGRPAIPELFREQFPNLYPELWGP